MEKWISLAFTALSGIIAITTTIALIKFKTEQVMKDGKDTKDRLEIVIRDLQGVLVQIATMSREQAVINQKVTETLTAILKKVERIEERVEQNHTDIEVLKDRADG